MEVMPEGLSPISRRSTACPVGRSRFVIEPAGLRKSSRMGAPAWATPSTIQTPSSTTDPWDSTKVLRRMIPVFVLSRSGSISPYSSRFGRDTPNSLPEGHSDWSVKHFRYHQPFFDCKGTNSCCHVTAIAGEVQVGRTPDGACNKAVIYIDIRICTLANYRDFRSRTGTSADTVKLGNSLDECHSDVLG